MAEDSDVAAKVLEFGQGRGELVRVGFDVDKELVLPDLTADRAGVEFGEIDAEIGEDAKGAIQRAWRVSRAEYQRRFVAGLWLGGGWIEDKKAGEVSTHVFDIFTQDAHVVQLGSGMASNGSVGGVG